MQVELPVVSGQDSPRKAFDAMKSAGRSGVIVRLGTVHAMGQAGVVAAAAHQNIVELQEATGLILVPEVGPYILDPGSLRFCGQCMVIPGLHRATINVGNYWKTLLESGPPLCFCDANNHSGSPEGSACQEPGCPDIIYCLGIMTARQVTMFSTLLSSIQTALYFALSPIALCWQGSFHSPVFGNQRVALLGNRRNLYQSNSATLQPGAIFSPCSAL